MDKNKNKSKFSESSISGYFLNSFTPICLTSLILAPANRIKIILQTSQLINMQENLKTYKYKDLIKSNIYSIIFRFNN